MNSHFFLTLVTQDLLIDAIKEISYLDGFVEGLYAFSKLVLIMLL